MALWKEILSLANKWTIEIKSVVDDNISIQFTARVMLDELSEGFKRSFEKIRREHNPVIYQNHLGLNMIYLKNS